MVRLYRSEPRGEAQGSGCGLVPARRRRKRRAAFEPTVDGRMLLQPCRSMRQLVDTTPKGVAFMKSAALNGTRMLPLSGVMGHLQSTSWTTCVGCDRRRSDRMVCHRMRGMQDAVMVPDGLVWRALTCRQGGTSMLPVWQCVRRQRPAVIDHTVSEGHLWVDHEPGVGHVEVGVCASPPQRKGPAGVTSQRVVAPEQGVARVGRRHPP